MREGFAVKIKFYKLTEIENKALKYAIIVSKYKAKWIFVRHRDRLTWEIPAGHREEFEHINEAARRELFEETGATEFKLVPICNYSVDDGEGEVFGRLFYAEIKWLGELPGFEIEERRLFEELPEKLTYPLIQPILFYRTINSLSY